MNLLNFTYRTSVSLYENFSGDIRSVRFTVIRKGVFSEVKFDSAEGELSFARIIERDKEVLNWLRPAPKEFNITYNHGKNYEPDFVVETEDTIYLVEVKAERDLNNPNVIAKKKRGILYCETVTHWSEANSYKPWKYLFIPANQVYQNLTFNAIAKKFTIKEKIIMATVPAYFSDFLSKNRLSENQINDLKEEALDMFIPFL